MVVSSAKIKKVWYIIAKVIMSEAAQACISTSVAKKPCESPPTMRKVALASIEISDSSMPGAMVMNMSYAAKR